MFNLKPPDMMRFMKGFTSRNLGLKVLALALAVVLWWFVAGESKVLVGFAVPLEIRNVPSGMTITNKVERQVEVRLSGPPSLLGGVQQADVSATIDLSDAKAGRQVVHLEERSIKVPPGVKVQRIYPNHIEVYLDRLERRRLPVVARVTGLADSRRKISRIVVSPSSLEVEALPDELARMKNLPVYVPAPAGEPESFAANARVDLREGHARIVGNPEVKVTVHFRK